MHASIVILVDSRVGRSYYRVLLASVQPTLPTLRVRPPGSSVALLGETPRPSGFALRVRQLLYLGRPQDRTGSPLALLGETPRPQWLTALTHQLLYLGKPQDRTGSPFCMH